MLQKANEKQTNQNASQIKVMFTRQFINWFKLLVLAISNTEASGCDNPAADPETCEDEEEEESSDSSSDTSDSSSSTTEDGDKRKYAFLNAFNSFMTKAVIT